MSQSRRFLIRMVLFLVLVAGLAALLGRPLVNAFMGNPAVNGVILGILIAGIVYIFRQVLSLDPEIRWIEEFRNHETGGGAYAGPKRRVFTLGIGGPVGSGKTALVERLCREFWPAIDLAVVTNDIYTNEDAEFLVRAGTLPQERIRGVETGGCPHAAIREDASMNLEAIADLENLGSVRKLMEMLRAAPRQAERAKLAAARG